MDARDPQSDREYLLKLDGKFENLEVRLDNLAHSIDNFGNQLVNLEKSRIASLEQRIIKIENIWQQVRGGWKLAIVLWLILSAVLGWIISWALTKFT